VIAAELQQRAIEAERVAPGLFPVDGVEERLLVEGAGDVGVERALPGARQHLQAEAEGGIGGVGLLEHLELRGVVVRVGMLLVEELPAYAPAGEGAHTFLHVEKRALTTEQMAQAIARALGVPRAEVGVAGQKDRQAVTRQWISVPGVDPERALALSLDGIRVL